MKKIISGKVYDTDTAKELGSFRSPGGPGDFSHYEETLYRKKTGEFFLYGIGGPMSRYAKADGLNSWSGGDRIMPMSFAEAREWAENNLGTEDYEEIFGEVTEDDSRVQVCYSLSAAAVETIRRRAAEAGISASAYIESLLS